MIWLIEIYKTFFCVFGCQQNFPSTLERKNRNTWMTINRQKIIWWILNECETPLKYLIVTWLISTSKSTNVIMRFKNSSDEVHRRWWTSKMYARSCFPSIFWVLHRHRLIAMRTKTELNSFWNFFLPCLHLESYILSHQFIDACTSVAKVFTARFLLACLFFVWSIL